MYSKCGGVAEVAVVDLQHAVDVSAGQDADLVVMKAAALQLQPAMLKPDASAVAVGHPRAPEADVVDADVTIPHHPDRFAFSMLAGRVHHGLGAQAHDVEPALGDHRHITAVGAGQHLDGVAVSGQAQRVGNAGQGLARAHAPWRAGGR